MTLGPKSDLSFSPQALLFRVTISVVAVFFFEGTSGLYSVSQGALVISFPHTTVLSNSKSSLVIQRIHPLLATSLVSLEISNKLRWNSHFIITSLKTFGSLKIVFWSLPPSPFCKVCEFIYYI